jgi:nitrite reductase/ring-hydroxylating ferredoxin subunit
VKVFRRPSAAPLWRDEFAISTADERYVNRRQFAKFLVLTSLGMFVGNLWILARSWWRKEPEVVVRNLGPLAEVPVGGVHLFSYPGPQDPCLLVRLAEDHYVAYSQKCTHLSCAVYYAREAGRLECPCHEGYFAVEDGSVLQGPPPRPLPRVVLEKRGADVVAVGFTSAAHGKEKA